MQQVQRVLLSEDSLFSIEYKTVDMAIGFVNGIRNCTESTESFDMRLASVVQYPPA